MLPYMAYMDPMGYTTHFGDTIGFTTIPRMSACPLSDHLVYFCMLPAPVAVPSARKDLLPHAAAEPIYWSKPFELELFTLLEVCRQCLNGCWGSGCEVMTSGMIQNGILLDDSKLSFLNMNGHDRT